MALKTNKKKRIIWSKLFGYLLALIISLCLLWLAIKGYHKWSIDRFSNQDILSKVSTHILLPKGDPKRIIRINNIETLREQNDFYKGLEEGDFILIYSKKAYIYDSRNDILRDVMLSKD